MGRLGTETAFEVLARARALEARGNSVLHFEIGEPDFDTPANVKNAAVAALSDGWTHYGPAAGDPELREVIAAYVGTTRGVEVDPGQVVVTPGAKPIMFFAILACVEPGDEVIHPNPGFPIYESMIEFIGATAVPWQPEEEQDFGFSVDTLRGLVTPKTRMVIINSPQNPTGGVLSAADMKEIREIARANNLIVLSDEIYSRIIYDGEHHSILSGEGIASYALMIDGFSKTYAMTGWRLGYGVMPKEIAEHVEKLMVNSNSCTASFTQRAGIEALTGSQQVVQEMVAAFRQRRDVIVDGLNSLPGFRCRTPKGAFYAFPNITGTGLGSGEAEELFLEKAGVACLSGTSFGKFGEGYLRFSYANSVENIEIALESLKRLLSG